MERKLASKHKAKDTRPYKEPVRNTESAILTELAAETPGKITKVRSCSDCCMLYNPDGTENTVGKAFRKQHTNCQWCPITQNMTEAEFSEVLAEIDGCE